MTGENLRDLVFGDDFLNNTKSIIHERKTSIIWTSIKFNIDGAVRVAAGASAQYAGIEGSIPGQDTYRSQLVNA